MYRIHRRCGQLVLTPVSLSLSLTPPCLRLGTCWTPKQRLLMEGVATTDVVIVHGNSHPELANLIANRLGVKSGGASVYHKPNRESMVEIGDSVRGKDIYIIQTGTK